MARKIDKTYRLDARLTAAELAELRELAKLRETSKTAAVVFAVRAALMSERKAVDDGAAEKPKH